ncbi:4-galactosyl-N-acetylglucosaminide 3-alpha-L-fucosyltransferase 9-like [Protopterus annectens]|uniref:4-galactosyl-N-acetylglucosaminide 3-alpha-L-fucosyltransferase 9-like n=1 Tax=Protopterus annectens TaxID=7888 RepID=UPI001CF9C24E|nr:4-galactosyl-N-acetylglucosaminide 3-alpha-L-fucosyltransferase 9-like [Protopterus annectens]XP_043936674.1 4-galactosyl-N-acetylglucosaminide 3-alpha-L-fucosyltransferase 9-like [Protopterus annectens]XP_043936675.1 4-galactosyl-N-acetylglucosaminide 3-alpha-L-fucosyltransferase 9-like [Protopterus annectens]
MDPFNIHILIKFLALIFILAFCFFLSINIFKDKNDITSVKYQKPTKETKKAERKSSLEPQYLTVLLWNWPFGVRFDLDVCLSKYGISNCRVTADHSMYDTADAVVFHYSDLNGNPNNLPQRKRPGKQYWVWYNMEPPENCGGLEKFNSMFNLSLSYRKDSDIFIPYGYLQFVAEPQDYMIPIKSKLAAWVVSNWNPNLERVKYYEKLKKYLTIDIYGKHHMPIEKNDHYSIIYQYKFYFAFESSLHTDYITEKLFGNSFNTGTVPVVMGPPREIYEQFIPPNSFIHVDDFKTAEDLANYLKYLDQNDEVYRSYFIWRKHYRVVSNDVYSKPCCAVCDKIAGINRSFRVVTNLHKWFWS